MDDVRRGAVVTARTERIAAELRAVRRAVTDPRSDASLALDEAAGRLLEAIGSCSAPESPRAGPGVVEGTTPAAPPPEAAAP